MNRRIVKTEAVILKRMDYLESSRIVTLYTRDEGKVSVLAKGARSRTNRFGAALEPGAVVQVVYYTRPHRELQTLTQADVIERFRGLDGTMVRLTAALHVLDIAHAVTDADHAHPELYDLIVSALRSIDASEAGVPAILLGYRLKISHTSGLTPGLTTCMQCGRSLSPTGHDESVIFDVRRGGVLCASCSALQRTGGLDAAGPRVRIRFSRVKQMRRLLESDFDAYLNDTLDAASWNELDGLLRSYERHHVLHGRSLKTESMVKEFIV